MTRVRAITDEIVEYCDSHSNFLPEALQLVELHNSLESKKKMQTTSTVGTVLSMLAQLMVAREVVEVGTFTGYSGLVLADALKAGGRLTSIDVDERTSLIAGRIWIEAGYHERIRRIVMPASAAIEQLAWDQPIDLAYVDADKGSYQRYLEALLPLMRKGGVFVFDNVLHGAQVLDRNERRESVVAIRQFNQDLSTDGRVRNCMIPVGDGLSVAIVI